MSKVLISIFNIINQMASHISYDIRTVMTFFRISRIILNSCRQLNEIQTGFDSRAYQWSAEVVKAYLHAHVCQVLNSAFITYMINTIISHISRISGN